MSEPVSITPISHRDHTLEKRRPIMTPAVLPALLALAAAISAVAAPAHAAAAEASFPVRPIRLVVPFPPGGTPDIQARLLTEKLVPRLGQPVVIDNRGGANGIIGMEIVAKAPADGHTLAVATVGTWSVHPFLYKLPYSIE